MKHTPTPWAVATDDHERSLIATVGSCGSRVFGVRFDQRHEVNYEEHSSEDHDAAFIVLACNTHDALLSLAERYASECAECGGGGVIEPVQPNGSRPCPACADTRQVIATAKGGRT